MDKETYFELSIKQNLPNRCPILQYCLRRAYTVYFYSDYKDENYSNDIIKTLINAGEIPPDFSQNKINLIGEVPSWSKAKGYGGFSGMCPEVNLFDTNNNLSYFRKTACSDGNWDNETMRKFNIITEKHYSECAEFSMYSFNNFNQPKNKNKETSCYTYLMFDIKTGYYKIGISKNPIYREKTLQSQQPLIKTLAFKKFATRKAASDMEKYFHNMYFSQRKRGEWFELTKADEHEIIKFLSE